jgi:3-oxoacyl-[acyl-carrier protein] reductase
VDLGIKGRTALVAGASAGIGKAIALVLSEEGAKVAILSRDKERITAAAKDIIDKTAGEVLPAVCDVTDKMQIDAAIANVNSHFGVIDILVCNAGGPPMRRFEQMADGDWDAAYNLNLKSTIRLCAAVIPAMKKQKWGRIINITSIAAIQANEALILSSTIRPGVHGLTKSLSNEFAQYGITVNTICPGFTNTERLVELAVATAKATGVKPERIYDGWKQNIPAGRLAEPEELGYLAAFLASEKAAYINGVALSIDGGFIRTI